MKESTHERVAKGTKAPRRVANRASDGETSASIKRSTQTAKRVRDSKAATTRKPRVNSANTTTKKPRAKAAVQAKPEAFEPIVTPVELYNNESDRRMADAAVAIAVILGIGLVVLVARSL